MGKGNKQITFDYIKSAFFRVIHVDGVHGGLSPNLNIHMGLFSERRPIPKQTTYNLNDNGTLGQEDASARKERETDMVRELDIEAIIDIATAQAIVGWLQNKIQEAEEIQKKIGEIKK